MANKSVQNIKNLLSNPTSRTMIIVTGAVVGAALVLGNFVSSSAQQRPSDLAAQVSVGGAPSVTSVPGTSDSARHNQLVKEANREDAEAALKSGGSAVPRLRASTTGQTKDPFELLQKKEDKQPEIVTPTVTQPTANQQVRDQPAVQAPVAAAPVKVRHQLDERKVQSSIEAMIGAWTPQRQLMETDYTGKGAPKEEVGAGATGNSLAAGGSGVGGSASTTPVTKAIAVKAGTIMNAVIMTSINSDEPGPILAQVVSGPYEGARLIGKFEMPQNASKVILTFSVITMPGAPKSYPISTYAIEPNTGRTALASDVDNHYLQRYGLLSGAAFMKGYSQAIMQSGATQTTTVGAGGASSQTTFPTLDAKKTNLAALGEVGTVLGASLAANANRPATVTLNQGTAVGILFMQDASF